MGGAVVGEAGWFGHGCFRALFGVWGLFGDEAV